MIVIGKSLTALGVGGLKPEICVTAQAGAVLNLHYKDSSIILQSYQLGADETQHIFVVDVSETAYVIDDATSGKSVEVLVDTVARYSVEIEYVKWLYRNGKIYDIVGDFLATTATYSTNRTASVVKNDTTLQVVGSLHSSLGASGAAYSSNQIDFSSYKQVMIKQSTSRDSQVIASLKIHSSKNVNNPGAAADNIDKSGNVVTQYLNISDIMVDGGTAGYIYYYMYVNAGYDVTGTLYELALIPK